MTSPLPLPDWVPWWVHLVLLLGILLFGLLFLLMPFSVFGVKARLEGVEARLDEIQGEIRSLALRLPEPLETDTSYIDPDSSRGGYVGNAGPPIPPAMRRLEPRVVRPGGRTEPRLR